MAMLAPWRSPLARALHRSRQRPESRYLQLATVQPNGRPANRTVVFRRHLDAANALVTITDGRSQKVTDVAHQPWGAACWYFTQTREQFRFSGPLQLITAADADQTLRRQVWEDLSEKARQQFTWPQPGEPKSEIEAFSAPAPAEATAPFCLLILTPQEVVHLALRGNPQERTRYWYEDGHWQMAALNP